MEQTTVVEAVIVIRMDDVLRSEQLTCLICWILVMNAEIVVILGSVDSGNEREE